MSTHESLDFQCEHCSKMFSEMLFVISKTFERVHFASGDYPEIEIRYGESVANFCSRACLESERAAVMAREGVPIRRPGIGPVEQCNKCQRPVDMTEFHLTYLESAERILSTTVHQPIDVDYLSVLCRHCSIHAVRIERGELVNIHEQFKLVNIHELFKYEWVPKRSFNPEALSKKLYKWAHGVPSLAASVVAGPTPKIDRKSLAIVHKKSAPR